jgi:hypothetical protein
MIGEILDAKYRIDKQLGAGGMGNVYLATHLGTTRIVAVKVIAPKWASEPQFLARFQREAQACGRLRHPNIVNVTDFGIANQVPYLVMEYLDGQTLSDFYKTNPTIALPTIADLLDQIGLALAEAHSYGIVHRDLKPDNIWLEPNGRGGYTVKVLDFGVAKLGWAPPIQETITPRPAMPADDVETLAIDSSGGAQTMPGSLLGTPAYMSPEQAFGKEIDFRSDIYSLAVVAYSLTCRTLPFAGRPSELFEYHETGSPPRPAAPRDVADAIMAGLARDPADRPASAIAFTRRFHNAVDAEFLALRRSKAFLMQHLTAFALLLIPGYGTIIAITAIMYAFSKKVVFVAPFAAAALFVFSDNVLRAAAASMALDEQVRVRRFLSFRVFWKIVKMLPVLAVTQLQAVFFVGPGYVIGDCLWPVVCVVEKLSGKAAIQRSRDLMTGLRSAGRALAIRHFALAGMALMDALESFSFVDKTDNAVITALWFPLFAIFAGAPLFLYDRTAANELGPLLQLNRTPEVRTTKRLLSASSAIWVALGLLYLLIEPFRHLFLSRR